MGRLEQEFADTPEVMDFLAGLSVSIAGDGEKVDPEPGFLEYPL